uniref:MIP37025p1 n=1 Tax=Drosophila melanogaster TaxID=7227 RepID=R9UI13_DROME|nr:MIP37025p1 [Drosophila melanogaster]
MATNDFGMEKILVAKSWSHVSAARIATATLQLKLIEAGSKEKM